MESINKAVCQILIVKIYPAEVTAILIAQITNYIGYNFWVFQPEG